MTEQMTSIPFGDMITAYRAMMTTPLGEAHNERVRQDELWGEQNHPVIADDAFSAESREYYAEQAHLWKLANAFRKAKGGLAWDGILLEEVCEALESEDPAVQRAELIQVAAVALAAVESLDRAAAKLSVDTEPPGSCNI